MNKKEYAQLCFESKSMQDFIEKDTFDVVDLSTGVFGLEKLDIKKDFCFGYGYCGVSTLEDAMEADKMASAARTEKYFMDENLKGITDTIKMILDALNGNNLFEYKGRMSCIVLYDKYSGTPGVVTFATADSSLLCGVITKETLRDAFAKRYSNVGKVSLATQEDLQTLLVAYTKQKMNFIKRLGNWWKRYGASHLHTWSYLSD